MLRAYWCCNYSGTATAAAGRDASRNWLYTRVCNCCSDTDGNQRALLWDVHPLWLTVVLPFMQNHNTWSVKSTRQFSYHRKHRNIKCCQVTIGVNKVSRRLKRKITITKPGHALTTTDKQNWKQEINTHYWLINDKQPIRMINHITKDWRELEKRILNRNKSMKEKLRQQWQNMCYTRKQSVMK